MVENIRQTQKTAQLAAPEWRNTALAMLSLGTVGRDMAPVKVTLETSQRVDGERVSRPRLSVVVTVGVRAMRLDAEPPRDSVEQPLAHRVARAITALLADEGALSDYRDMVAEWKAQNPLPERPARGRGNGDNQGNDRRDGGPNRGLRAKGKTEKKRKRERGEGRREENDGGNR